MKPISIQTLLAEYLGTGALLATVIGSGVMAERLAAGNVAIALLANTLATVAILFVLIELYAPLSGAHFNPVVTAIKILLRESPAASFVPYVGAQLLGAMCGAWLVHAMFALPVLQWSTHVRASPGELLGEVVATAGLILVVLRAPPAKASAMVACYIGAAYWFTSSTSFANPAAAFGRMFSDSFAGIAPSSVPMFVVAQVIGAGIGFALHRALGK